MLLIKFTNVAIILSISSHINGFPLACKCIDQQNNDCSDFDPFVISFPDPSSVEFIFSEEREKRMETQNEENQACRMVPEIWYKKWRDSLSFQKVCKALQMGQHGCKHVDTIQMGQRTARNSMEPSETQTDTSVSTLFLNFKSFILSADSCKPRASCSFFILSDYYFTFITVRGHH